jgi:hypothetical protein
MDLGFLPWYQHACRFTKGISLAHMSSSEMDQHAPLFDGFLTYPRCEQGTACFWLMFIDAKAPDRADFK